MWLIKVFSVIYFTAVCAAQDPEDVTSLNRPVPSTAIPTVYEPPVPSLKLLSTYGDVFPSEKVEFSCNITDNSDWTLTLYRNEQPVQHSGVSLSAEGSRFIITAATQIHSGSYTCKGQHKTKGVSTAASNLVKLTVHANKPKPTLTRSTNYKMFPGESVSLQCTVQELGQWEYLWYHNGSEIQGANGNIHKVSVTHPNSGQYHCKAKRGKGPFYTEESDKTTLQVSEPPVPSLKLLSTYGDVFPSEKVEFSCNITDNSDWTLTWYRNEQPVQDSGVSLSAEGSRFIITAATQIHSGSYTCKGQHKTKGVSTAASNLVKLTVHANKPKPTLTRSTNYKMFPGESVSLQCTVQELGQWEYLWYHNGSEIQGANGNIHKVSVTHPYSGQYHCKAKRGKGPFYTEESDKTTLQVSDPPKPSLKQLSPWSDVFQDEMVEIRCEVGSSDWTFTWYKNRQQLQDSALILDAEEPLLNITSVNTTHQGDYSCKAQHKSRGVSTEFSNTISITVYEKTPKPSLSKDPDFNPMYVGEKVTFNCNVNVSSGWEYQLYKDENLIPNSKTHHEILLGLSDEGTYSCKATRAGTTSTDVSEKRSQAVRAIPVPSLKLKTPWQDVFPTESARLSCEMDGSSGWTYTWYKDHVVYFESDKTILSINSASAAHAGQYYCTGQLNNRSVRSSSSTGLTLTVYDKKPSVTLTRDPDYKVMFPGESVSFSCHINVSSGWTYLWHKDRKQLVTTVPENNYTIRPVGITDRGSYTCQAKRGTDLIFKVNSTQSIHLEVSETKPKPLMTQQPNVDMVYTGESVSFGCKVELSSGWRYHWYKDEKQIATNSSSYNISDGTVLHSGTYKCKAIRDKTGHNTEQSDVRMLRVSEIPVPSLKLITPWKDVFPTESVRLSCEMDGSSEWRYTWYKDRQEVQSDNVVSFESDRTILSINSTSAAHAGQYSCSGNLKSRSVVHSNFSSGLTLDVHDMKPRVMLMKNPEYNVMHTGDSVSFKCHINVSSGWTYLWYKDGIPFLPTSGDSHNITVELSHTGSYKCQVKRGSKNVFQSDQSQDVTLEIKERPQADIILLTGWSEVFSTDSLVLRCGVQESQDMWNYTWFKEDQQINELSEKHTVTPQNDPEQSHYICQGKRIGQPSYSKKSDSFKTKNLLLKRRVLLSISGCLFFGIIVVFLGCIVLRVIRKPADDDDKPEEANLFLTMAQLKDRSDAPCPLVEYLTDEALNASSKEGDENGTVCSETTPLPINPQEDQAVTTESQDATEHNGGLVSFKQ